MGINVIKDRHSGGSSLRAVRHSGTRMTKSDLHSVHVLCARGGRRTVRGPCCLTAIIIVLYNSNVAGFIAVTDDAFIVPDLSIRSQAMPKSFVLAVTISWTESNPSLCSLHQVSSIRRRLSSCTLGLVSPLSGVSRAVFRP
jgi:hypothetical protein